MGTGIGIFSATTLILQFNLFTEMPFEFSFPTFLYSTVIILALLSALGGSWFPAREYQVKRISNLIKGAANS
jgi:ABC-type antimicrobial peptide transport system permease subunit